MSLGAPLFIGGCIPYPFFAFGSSFDHLQRLEDRDGSMN